MINYSGFQEKDAIQVSRNLFIFMESVLICSLSSYLHIIKQLKSHMNNRNTIPHSTLYNRPQNDSRSDLTISSSKRKKIQRSNSKNNAQDLSYSKQQKRRSSKTEVFVFEDFMKNQFEKTKEKMAKNVEKENKRESTPCKSRNLISFYADTIKKSQVERVQAFEAEMEINELKKEVDNLKRKQGRLRSEIKILENQNKNLSYVVAQIKKELSDERQTVKQNDKTIAFLQKSILQAENNLESTKKNFQKLQKQIKVNQVSNLKTLISKLQKQNSQLMASNQTLSLKIEEVASEKNKIEGEFKSLESAHKSYHHRESYLQQEIESLKKQLEQEKGTHVKLLQSKINALLQDRQILIDKSDRLQIQLDFLSRKSLEQYQICIKKKNNLISSLTKKNKQSKLEIQALQKELKDFRIQKSQRNIVASDSRISGTNKIRHEVREIRESVMTADHCRPRVSALNEEIDFSLSPE